MSLDATIKFLETASKVNADTEHRTMASSSYLTYMEEVHQHPPAVIKAVAESKKELITGMQVMARNDLVAQIEEAKKNGESPDRLATKFRAATPDGPITVTITAHSSVVTPGTGERIEKYGRTGVRVKVGSLVDGAVATKTEEIIGKLMTDK